MTGSEIWLLISGLVVVAAFIAGIVSGKDSLIIGQPYSSPNGNAVCLPVNGKIEQIPRHTLGHILCEIDDSIIEYNSNSGRVFYQVNYHERDTSPIKFHNEATPIEYLILNSDNEPLLQKIVSEYRRISSWPNYGEK